jgi:antibiotic biosynthesis monooxygenase (ABM) superfamily enzyme
MRPQPRWEGTILAFAMIFTVLLGVVYGVAGVFKFAVPWLAILILSIAVTLVLRYFGRRQM